MKNRYQNSIGKLWDELKSEDTKKRENSCRNLHLIAKTFGLERTKNNLLPFIKDELEDDEEEVLISIIGSLEKIIQEFPNKNLIYDLYPHFKKFLKSEDYKVRIKTIELMKKIFENHNLIDKKLFELVKKLNSSENIYSKISCVLIISRLNNFIPKEYLTDSIKIIENNYSNENPKLRKEIAINLNDLFKLDYDDLIINILCKLIKDSQELVKIHALDTLLNNLDKIKKNNEMIYEIISNNIKNESWRVRYVILNNFDKILPSFMNKKTQLLTTFLEALKDPELEINIVVIKNFKKLIDYLDSNLITNYILSNIKDLINNKDINIKVAISEELLILCKKLKEKEINSSIIPNFNLIIKDNNSLVKISILKNYYFLYNIYKNDELTENVITNLKVLSNDKNWKIRYQSIETCCNIVLNCKEEISENKKILDIFNEKLHDEVFSVREVVLNSFKKIAVKYGIEYNEKYWIPILAKFVNNKSYLLKLNYLQGIKILSPYLSKNNFINHFKNLNNLVKDKVPNIRYNCIKSLLTLNKYSKNKDIQEKTLKICNILSKDNDSLVSKYASNFKSVNNFDDI